MAWHTQKNKNNNMYLIKKDAIPYYGYILRIHHIYSSVIIARVYDRMFSSKCSPKLYKIFIWISMVNELHEILSLAQVIKIICSE